MTELGEHGAAFGGPPGKGGTGNGPGANKVSCSGIASLNDSCYMYTCIQYTCTACNIWAIIYMNM